MTEKIEMKPAGEEETPDSDEIRRKLEKFTDPKEFDKFIELIEKSEGVSKEDLLLIPTKYDKSPDAKKSIKENIDEVRISPNKARQRLEKGGGNVGMYLQDIFAVYDIDNVEEARKVLSDDITKETLTISSRSGKPHIYFLKGDGIEGRDYKKNGGDVIEVRTGWRYVLVPGSYAYDEKDGKWGAYEVNNENEIATLDEEDLPPNLKGDYLESNEEIEEPDYDGKWLNLPCVKFIREHPSELPETGRRRKAGKILSLAGKKDGVSREKMLEAMKKFSKAAEHGHGHKPHEYLWYNSIESKNIQWNCGEIVNYFKEFTEVPCGDCELTEIAPDLKEEIEKYAFDKEGKPSWNCGTKFVTFLKNIEFDDKEIKFKDCYELPEELADRLLDEGIAVRYAWRCGKCRAIYRQKSKPNYCRNEECNGKKKHMDSIHPTKGYQMGDALLDNYYWATPIESRDENRTGLVHLYKDGIYHNDFSKGFVRTKTRMMNHVTRQSVQKHAMDLVGDLRSVPEKTFGLSGSRVVIRDGILELDELEVKPHDPNALALSKIDVEFDLEAEYPIFKRMLEEGIPSEKDRKRLQEVLGTGLTNEKPHKKGVILVGPTDAGKSTLIAIIRGVFGDENTESQSPYALSETRWGRARLRDVKLNMTDEINEKKLKNLNVLKRIMDGNPIDAEFKGEKKFEMYPTAEHLYAANQTPTANRKDDAFWNRWIPIEMPKSIPEDFPDKEEADPDLADKIVEEEKEGVFKWIVQGYLDFMGNGKRFTYPVDWRDARDTWLNWGSALQRFIQNHIEKDLDNKVTTREIYEQVVDYADENELDAPSSQKKVTDELKKIPYASYSKNYKIDGETGKRGFKGIKLTYEADKADNLTLTQVKEKSKDDNQKIRKSNNRCEKNRLNRLMDEVKKKLQHEGMGYTAEELTEEMDLESEDVAKTVLEALYEKEAVEKTKDEATGDTVYRAVQGRVEDLEEAAEQ